MCDLSVDHSPAVADHSPGPSKLSVSIREVVGRGVRRHPIISGVCSQAGRNSLVSPESGGSTPAPVGGESIASSSSSVCHGHSQRGCLSLSRPNEVFGSKWTLAPEVVDQLVYCWPANSDLFAMALNHRMPVYFAPMAGPETSGTDALLQCWSHLQVYTFPPFWLVFNEFWELTNCEVTLVAPWWSQQEYFSDLQ